MKTNKRPQLVISFANLRGQARSIVSAQVQLLLFSSGYIWSNNFWKGDPQYTDADSLHIGSHQWNPRHITYSNGPMGFDSNEGRTLVFDASSQLDAFLKEAEVGLVEVRVIEGVQVIVTPDSVYLNPTELLTKLSKQATAIQQELWG